MTIRAIFFDFDGVLANSEGYHCQLFQKVLDKYGFTLSRQEYYKTYIGFDDWECFANFFQNRRAHKKYQQDDFLEKLIKEKDHLFFKLINNRHFLYRGVPETITELGENWPLCIVSGALKPEIEAMLEPYELQKLFHFIIAPEDYERGKPDPDPYLKALEKMRQTIPDLKPKECLVVEDTVYGLQAGNAAGMKTVGVATSYPKKDLVLADAVISDTAVITGDLINSL